MEQGAPTGAPTGPKEKREGIAPQGSDWINMKQEYNTKSRTRTAKRSGFSSEGREESDGADEVKRNRDKNLRDRSKTCLGKEGKGKAARLDLFSAVRLKREA